MSTFLNIGEVGWPVAALDAAFSMDAGAGASERGLLRFLEMTRFRGGRDLRTRRSGLKESTVWISAAGATSGCGCAGTIIHASAAIEAVAADSLLRFLAGLGNSRLPGTAGSCLRV